MPDRDRIAEIIRNARMFADPLSQVGYAEADALLANGFIVPIRCKDCEYYTPIKHQSTKWKSKTFYCTRNANMKMNENDFCSCAKLKEREG